ncbi:UNVERIFIED_CONTAM: hypothetical protein GTU68_028865 [Idotea baltica]|nr:hypothetical protein [Idotea baltica]
MDVAVEQQASISGLTTPQVEEQRRQGNHNTIEQRTARSVGSIIRANVLTRFNAIITALAVVVLVFGDPIDAVFAAVMIFNSLIGIVQEVRAKRSLDALQVLIVPVVTVLRDGHEIEVAPHELVLGDRLHLSTGEQVPVDATVDQAHGLEVDESALTGESEPADKAPGDEILSGSAIVAGDAWAEAVRVGEDCWIQQLTREAKDFVLTESELRRGVDTVLRVVSWMLPPLAMLLVWSQLQASSSMAEGLIYSVAGVVALVPQGLVLLVSMALAVAVMRLGARNVVVQELPAVEGLARIDVLCVDKTGTLTTGELAVDAIAPLGAESVESVAMALAALTQLGGSQTSTMTAISDHLDMAPPPWTLTADVAFSSVRKWSGATFGEVGTIVLGAPEIVLAAMGEHADVQTELDERTAHGQRVLLLARTTTRLAGNELPDGLEPAALIALKEEVRPDAAETLAYFGRQDVEIKVISGDNPRTVAAVASELGVPNADRFVEMTAVDDLESIPAETAVFGRVRPEQKRDLVRLLQQRGHTVAMTGDGVNDIPSIKAADIGIAMNTATPATKAVAQLVLLDGKFSQLPHVVAEGRRVIANMERVSALFLTKTVYATLLVITVGIARVSFPFLPRHLSLIAAITIGIPGFFLSFRPDEPASQPGYLRRVLHFAVPAGIIAALATYAAYWLTTSPVAGATIEEARTAATLTLSLVGLFILHRLITPIQGKETWLLAGLVGLLGIAMIPSPWADFYALDLPPLRTSTIIVGVVAIVVIVLELALEWGRRRQVERAARAGDA